MSNIQKLRLDDINILAGTQSRAKTNDDTVTEYKLALEDGVEFPPVIVFSDGSKTGKWLADGFHRYHAHDKAGLVEIACDVRVGTLTDAILFSAGANGTHGLPRTNADKRSAVEMVLETSQCEDWSDRQIARHCKVSNNFVGDVRRAICHPMTDTKEAVRTVTRNGVTYEQHTAKIGRPTAPAATPMSKSPTEAPTAALASAPAAAEPLENADAPDFGAPALAPPAAVSLDTLADPEDADAPDTVDLLIAAEQKVEHLEVEVVKLRARVIMLEAGDLAKKIVKLEEDVRIAADRADRYYGDFIKANNKAIARKSLLDGIRKAAGLGPDDDLVAWARQAARRAA